MQNGLVYSMARNHIQAKEKVVSIKTYTPIHTSKPTWYDTNDGKNYSTVSHKI